MAFTEIPSHLRWACRRGMLELDVLLGNFLAEAFLNQPEKIQDLFAQLLSNTDPDLFSWLIGHAEPTDPDQALIVAKVRYHAKNRH